MRWYPCQGFRYENIKVNKHTPEEARKKTADGFCHLVGEGLHTYVSTSAFSNQKEWPLTGKLLLVP
jgi:hypothetical protein